MKVKLLSFCLFVFLSFSGIGSVYAQSQKTNLPALYIYTDNKVPVTNKVNYVDGRITVVSSDPKECMSEVTQIRGRGNSTWSMAKKPYRIKLNKKANLLNLPAKAKSWTLLANHADKTLIRNALAFKISTLIGMEFTPSARFVDLILNDRFLGNYMLSDQVQVNQGRVEVDELTNSDVDKELITGGYLLEIDGFAASEPVWFTTGQGLKITVKSPDEEEINASQLTYIKNYIADFESRLFSSAFKDPDSGYRAKVDTTSLINWYIGCELTGNSDSFWSTFIYKKRGDDKLYFGPMWDYDIAFNNDDRLGNAVRKLMRNHAHNPRTWIEQIYRDEWFQQAVWSRWNELVASGLEQELHDYISQTASLIDESQKLNFSSQLWPVLSTKTYRELYLFPTYDAGVNYLKDYITARIDFLTTSFKFAEPEKPSEAFVADDNYYYSILNMRTNNAISVKDASSDQNAQMVSMEPEEDNPSQLWEVRPAGNNTYRIVNMGSGLAMSGNGYAASISQRSIDERDNRQLWKIIPVNTGNVYALENVATGYTVNNSGGSFNNGNPIIEYASKIVANGSVYTLSSENQQWFIQKQLSKATSIADYETTSRFKAFYSQTEGKLYVDYLLAGEADVTIAVYDLFGRTVYRNSERRVLSENSVEIPISCNEPGVYVVLFSTNKGERISKKIVIWR